MTGSVGIVGMPKPMGLKNTEDLADIFYKRYGLGSKGEGLHRALIDFCQSRSVPIEDAKILQDQLVNKYGLYGLSSKIF